MSTTASSNRTTTDQDMAALNAEMQQLRGEFAKLAGILENTVRHAGEEAYRRARETGEQAWDEARERTEDVLEYIEKRPVASTATAFGIGMLIGMLFFSRR